MDESNPLKEPLDRLIDTEQLKDRQIIFFGANKSTKEMCTYLRIKGFEPYAIVDNDKRKQHQMVANLMTYLPEELLTEYHKQAVILIASEYFKEMSEQLVELGYDRETQIIQVLRLNRFYDTSKEAFEEYADKAREGENVYRRLVKAWKKNCHVENEVAFNQKFGKEDELSENFSLDLENKEKTIIEDQLEKKTEIISRGYGDNVLELNTRPNLILCPYPGTGDIYLIGLYLRAYCKKHGVQLEDCLITVVGKAASRVFALFSIQNLQVLSQTESDQLLSYLRVMGLKRMKTFVCNDGHLQYMTKRFRGVKGINFHQMFRTAVFGMDGELKEIDAEKASNCEKRKEHEQVQDHERMDQAREMCSVWADGKVKSQMERMTAVLHGRMTFQALRGKYPSLQKGISVLLSPYANTVTDVSATFWEHIAQECKKRGYQVFTNSIGESEPVIAGTEGIFIPFSEIIDFVEAAGCFIGVRSGLCDIISSAKAKKIILYPEGKLFRACSTYDYFSLNQMGLCEDAVELEYGDDGGAELEGKVIKLL